MILRWILFLFPLNFQTKPQIAINYSSKKHAWWIRLDCEVFGNLAQPLSLPADLMLSRTQMLKLSLCCLESWIAARGTFKLPIRFWPGALTGDLTYTQSYMKKQG